MDEQGSGLGVLHSDQFHNPEYDGVGEPHEYDPDDHVEDDIFRLFDLLFITSSDKDLESCIDDIYDRDDRDK